MNCLKHSDYSYKIHLISFILIFCIIFSVFPFTVKGAEAETMPSGISRDEVKNIIENCWNDNEKTAAGMSVSVFDREGVIYSNYFGYADKENKITLNEDHVIEWGSVSKTLIWVSAMQLKEQGKLDLEKDIREYLPSGFLHNLHYEKPITMINLMNHTAGFEEMIIGIETANKDDIVPLGEFLKINQPQQAFEPGTVTAYSNWGAALAGYIVECISGQPFYEYVNKNIFEVLGMKNTSLKPDLGDNPYVAEKRKELKCYLPDGSSAGNTFMHIILYPAGMCTSTLKDYTVYAMALNDPDTKLFKNKETYQEMITPTQYLGESDIAESCHGFWTGEFGDNVIGHGGNTSGCTSQLQFDTKTGVGMVVMTNQLGENKFNSEMVKEILGKPTADRHDGVNGYIMSARNIFSGPMKITSFFGTMECTEDLFQNIIAVRTAGPEMDIINMQAIDLLVISGGEYAAMIIPLILWIAAVFICFAALWTKLIRYIVRAMRKKENNIPLGKTTAAGSILVILPVLLFIPVMLDMSGEGGFGRTDYQIWSSAYLIIAAALAVLMVLSIILMFRNKMTVKRVIYNITAMLCMGTAIYNIVYWQLCMFWLI